MLFGGLQILAVSLVPPLWLHSCGSATAAVSFVMEGPVQKGERCGAFAMAEIDLFLRCRPLSCNLYSFTTTQCLLSNWHCLSRFGGQNRGSAKEVSLWNLNMVKRDPDPYSHTAYPLDPIHTLLPTTVWPKASRSLFIPCSRSRIVTSEPRVWTESRAKMLSGW